MKIYKKQRLWLIECPTCSIQESANGFGWWPPLTVATWARAMNVANYHMRYIHPATSREAQVGSAYYRLNIWRREDQNWGLHCENCYIDGTQHTYTFSQWDEAMMAAQCHIEWHQIHEGDL